MRILYASCRYNPFDRDAGSGVDFNIYEAFQQVGGRPTHSGPFKQGKKQLEKFYRNTHHIFSRKLSAKYSESYLRMCANIVDEAAGIVCSEAAAFGVPTITNAAGGLATTVKDGVSGIALPRGSKAERYVEAIEGLINEPGNYQHLRLAARERYEHELNWRSMVTNILTAFETLHLENHPSFLSGNFNQDILLNQDANRS